MEKTVPDEVMDPGLRARLKSLDASIAGLLLGPRQGLGKEGGCGRQLPTEPTAGEVFSGGHHSHIEPHAEPRTLEPIAAPVSPQQHVHVGHQHQRQYAAEPVAGSCLGVITEPTVEPMAALQNRHRPVDHRVHWQQVVEPTSGPCSGELRTIVPSSPAGQPQWQLAVSQEPVGRQTTPRAGSRPRTCISPQIEPRVEVAIAPAMSPPRVMSPPRQIPACPPPQWQKAAEPRAGSHPRTSIEPQAEPRVEVTRAQVMSPPRVMSPLRQIRACPPSQWQKVAEQTADSCSRICIDPQAEPRIEVARAPAMSAPQVMSPTRQPQMQQAAEPMASIYPSGEQQAAARETAAVVQQLYAMSHQAPWRQSVEPTAGSVVRTASAPRLALPPNSTYPTGGMELQAAREPIAAVQQLHGMSHQASWRQPVEPTTGSVVRMASTPNLASASNWPVLSDSACLNSEPTCRVRTPSPTCKARTPSPPQRALMPQWQQGPRIARTPHTPRMPSRGPSRLSPSRSPRLAVPQESQWQKSLWSAGASSSGVPSRQAAGASSLAALMADNQGSKLLERVLQGLEGGDLSLTDAISALERASGISLGASHATTTTAGGSTLGNRILDRGALSPSALARMQSSSTSSQAAPQISVPSLIQTSWRGCLAEPIGGMSSSHLSTRGHMAEPISGMSSSHLAEPIAAMSSSYLAEPSARISAPSLIQTSTRGRLAEPIAGISSSHLAEPIARMSSSPTYPQRNLPLEPTAHHSRSPSPPRIQLSPSWNQSTEPLAGISSGRCASRNSPSRNSPTSKRAQHRETRSLSPADRSTPGREAHCLLDIVGLCSPVPRTMQEPHGVGAFASMPAATEPIACSALVNPISVIQEPIALPARSEPRQGTWLQGCQLAKRDSPKRAWSPGAVPQEHRVLSPVRAFAAMPAASELTACSTLMKPVSLIQEPVALTARASPKPAQHNGPRRTLSPGQPQSLPWEPIGHDILDWPESCNSCEILELQVSALTQALAGLSGTACAWSAAFASPEEQLALNGLLLQYVQPCMSVNQELEKLCSEVAQGMEPLKKIEPRQEPGAHLPRPVHAIPPPSMPPVVSYSEPLAPQALAAEPIASHAMQTRQPLAAEPIASGAMQARQPLAADPIASGAMQTRQQRVDSANAEAGRTSSPSQQSGVLYSNQIRQQSRPGHHQEPQAYHQMRPPGHLGYHQEMAQTCHQIRLPGRSGNQEDEPSGNRAKRHSSGYNSRLSQIQNSNEFVLMSAMTGRMAVQSDMGEPINTRTVKFDADWQASADAIRAQRQPWDNARLSTIQQTPEFMLMTASMEQLAARQKSDAMRRPVCPAVATARG